MTTMRIFKFIAILAITLSAIGNAAFGQISITSSTAVTESFTIGTSTTASLPSNWKMTAAGVSAPTWAAAGNFTAVTQGASSGTPATGGRYNWGNGTTTTDRAIGFMTSAGYVSPNSIMAYYQNNTGVQINDLTIAFDYERYRVNSAACSITFFYSTDGSTWTAYTAGDNTFATGANAYNFNPTAVSKSVSITGVNIANTGGFYLRWNFNTTGSNSQGVGLDNVSVAATLPPTGATQDGAIGTSEYGTHTDGVNQNTNGAVVTYVSWDATNLYVAATGANLAEGMVFYLDKDPQVPVNGGTNANGTNVGFNYDGASFAELQFRADLVMYVKSGYREYRTADGSNGWSTQTAAFGSYAENSTGSIREYAIPWSAIGGMPSSMNFFSYITSSGGFVYGEQPTENGEGSIGTSARFDRYYTVTTTTVGSSTPPFSRNSYVFNSTSDNNTFGAISVWDFTMNTSGRQIARSGTGAWTIGGSLVVNNGSVYFGSGGTYGATTIANVNVLGGLLSMDQTNQSMNITGNLSQSAGTFNLSTNAGGDVDIDGNWTRTGGTFNANSRAVAFSGTAAQSIGGSTSTTFGYLTINNTSGTATGVTLGVATNVANQLTLTAGVLNTTATNILNITNTATTAVSGGSTTSFVKGPMTRSLPASLGTGSTYMFPTGKGTTYLPFSLVNPITGASAPVVTAEAFDANAGGTAGSTVASMSTTEYWTASATGDYTGGSVSLTRQTALGSLNIIARSATVSGTYSSLGGTPSSPSINNSTTTGATLGSFVMAVEAVVPTITSLGSSAGCVGTQIVINGTNFSGVVASGVQIGGTPVSSIVSNTGTVITAVIGNGTTGNITVTLGANTATSAGTFTVYSLPTAPANPTSDSPQCASPGVTLTRTGSPSGGDTWYWQTTNNGTSTAASGTTYNVTSSGTYYINSQSADGCWSATSGSLAITISTVPAIATSPSPANNAVGVCYSGGGAISNVTWGSVATATSYDVYFGAGSLPGSVTSNVATTSYSTGTLAASTTYYWMVVAKNSCGDAVGSTTWNFTTAASNCALSYCSPTYSSGGTNDYITQVTFGTLSQATASNVSPYYLNYTTTQNAVPTIQQAGTYSLSLTFGTDVDQYSGVWVDFDQSGTFDTSEYFSNGTNAGASGTTSISIFVPFGATLGTTTMRVRGGDDSAMTSAQACGATNSNFGQTQDYAVLIATAGPTIVATPAVLTLPNVQSGNTSTEVSYTLQGVVLSPVSGNIVVTAPTGFEVSLTSGSGFASSINVPYTGSALAATTIYVHFVPSANNTYYSGNITNAGGGATTANVALSANSYTTLSALFDNFNRTDNTTVGTPSSGGASAWTEIETSGDNFRARIETNMLRLHACANTTGSTGGTTSEQASFDLSAKYATTYTTVNSNYVWSFNMHTNNSNPSGFVGGNYGIAFIVGCTESNFLNASADGYAVVCGASGSPDAFRLVSFTGGIGGTLTDITSYTPSLATEVDDFYSIKVSLNTCTNEWTLSVRSDGTTAFADPAAGTYVNVSSATNSTHTSKNLKHLGGLWKHSSSCTTYAEFDNISIPTGVAPVIATGITGTATTCPSTTGLTYTASVPGATTYSWTVPTGWSVTAGAGTSSITVTSGTGGQNGNISVTGSNSCGTLGSTSLAVVVNNSSAVSVSISEDVSSPICAGTSVTFTATPTNGGTSPSYQWYIGASPVGTNSDTYTTTALANGNSVTVLLTSDVVCPTPSATVTSNAIVYTVNPILTPSVSIAASPSSTICVGDNVTFTATPTNGGTTPSYQWYIGATPVGTNSATYASSALANGDAVSVVMTNNLACPTSATSTSNTITMTVNSISSVSVSISEDVPSPICAGTSVTFTASPTNGGTTPSYQWYIGASPVGTNSATFNTSALANGNSVTVQMTSNAICPVPTTATSNAIVYTVTAAPTWYLDADGDGYGTGVSTTACTQPVGYTISTSMIATTGDCNDAVEDIHPGADEWCNSTDDDCDASIDEGLTSVFYYQDNDGDGYRSAFIFVLACTQPAGYLPGSAGIDCNDSNAGIYPGSIEICANSIDDDCDSAIDENCPTNAPLNDSRIGAFLATIVINDCNEITGTLENATYNSNEDQTTSTGSSVWYYFTALSSGVQISCTSLSNNIRIDLESENGTDLNNENLQSNNYELLNYVGLIPGETYYVSIRNLDITSGTNFELCINGIHSSSIDVLASNPLALYGRCGNIKADYIQGATQYIFHFGSSIHYITPNSNTVISLSSISDLTFSTNYSVTVDAIKTIYDSNGDPEITTIPGADATNIYINPQPDLDLRSQDTAPNSKPFHSFISTNQYMCAAISYDWSFQEVTEGDVLIAPVATITNSGSPSRYLKVNGTNIFGAAIGKFFRVMVRPVFSTGPGLWYTDYQILSITGNGGMVLEETSTELEETLMEKEMRGENFATIYPNPNNGQYCGLNVVNTIEGTTQVRIMNNIGQVVYTNQFATGEGIFNTAIVFEQELANGLYMVEITLADKSIVTERMVVGN